MLFLNKHVLQLLNCPGAAGCSSNILWDLGPATLPAIPSSRYLPDAGTDPPTVPGVSGHYHLSVRSLDRKPRCKGAQLVKDLVPVSGTSHSTIHDDAKVCTSVVGYSRPYEY